MKRVNLFVAAIAVVIVAGCHSEEQAGGTSGVSGLSSSSSDACDELAAAESQLEEDQAALESATDELEKQTADLQAARSAVTEKENSLQDELTAFDTKVDDVLGSGNETLKNNMKNVAKNLKTTTANEFKLKINIRKAERMIDKIKNFNFDRGYLLIYTDGDDVQRKIKTSEEANEVRTKLSDDLSGYRRELGNQEASAEENENKYREYADKYYDIVKSKYSNPDIAKKNILTRYGNIRTGAKNLGKSKENEEISESNVKVATSNIAVAEGNLELAKKEVERLKEECGQYSSGSETRTDN